MYQQLSLFAEPIPETFLESVDPFSYDHIIVAFSGGKDSLACLLYLLSLGVKKSVMELWHHDIDGREGSRLMDWPVTRDYCRAVAEAFGIPIYFSWKVGGFETEMLRENARTAPTKFETPEGIIQTGGMSGKYSTRRLFPQISANLAVRWCSAYLKVDIASKSLAGQDRFLGKRILMITGERAEESASRACYKRVEVHRTSSRKRHVDHWRPVHHWKESEIWGIIEEYRVNPHPCYRLSWGRCSCAACIFGSKDQWASLAAINPAQVQRIADYEKEFGKTINRTKSVSELVAMGSPYADMDPTDVKAALANEFNEPVILAKGSWRLPAGAHGEKTGPT